MKKETVEEVAERFYPTPNPYIMGIDIGNTIKREAFIQGVKWQQEQDREIEKEKIMDSYVNGLIDPLIMKNYKGLSVDEIRIELKKQAAEYYNETFKNEIK